MLWMGQRNPACTTRWLKPKQNIYQLSGLLNIKYLSTINYLSTKYESWDFAHRSTGDFAPSTGWPPGTLGTPGTPGTGTRWPWQATQRTGASWPSKVSSWEFRGTSRTWRLCHQGRSLHGYQTDIKYSHTDILCHQVWWWSFVHFIAYNPKKKEYLYGYETRRTKRTILACKTNDHLLLVRFIFTCSPLCLRLKTSWAGGVNIQLYQRDLCGLQNFYSMKIWGGTAEVTRWQPGATPHARTDPWSLMITELPRTETRLGIPHL